MKLLRLTIWAMLILSACKKSETVFTAIPAKHSGIDFVNEIVEYDSFNILNTEFIYNGAGIGIGDLNEDGLEDLFFSGNQAGNVCYLNLGNFKFKDITRSAKLHKPDSGMWSSGVTILDLNADGKKDIYVTNTLIKNASKRKNLFYLNTGNSPEGLPQFTEMASEYGLDDTSYASHAQFFDYDRDGDLDLFIGTNFIDRPVMGQYVKDINEGCNENCDKLYRNDWDSIKKHPFFVDVSAAAGMTLHGYSHSTLIHDFNEDGWPDIYIANDYQSDDLIYINNADGSFTNKVSTMFRHQSSAAMGSDLGDINNDGKAEVMTVEMLPFTNLRKKTLIGPANYSSYIYVKQYGYQYQYTRNTLQLNQGMKNGYPVYGDISFLSGVHETEWSWAPLFVDIDLDSYQDLYITNGFPKDVTDHDFGEYRNETRGYISDMDLQNL
ncbi:MAG: VCBS repeat-containing protein, partial [Saprospiraceae bacterium]|nr:VCBS repeat-containing protein [Saprospiraceae bacterium]